MAALLVDDRWSGPHGIGRYATEILRRLPPFEGLGTRLAPTSPWSVLHLAEQCRRRRPAVFYSPAYMGPLSGGTPTVLTLHDLIPLEAGSQTSVASRLFFRHLLPTVARRAACVLTVSECSRTALLDRFGLDPAQVRLAPNGLSAGFSPSAAAFATDRPYFLLVAPSRTYKNRRAVLQAFARSPRLGGFDLRIVGDALSAAEQTDIPSALLQRVKVHTGLAETALPGLYRGAVGLVHPALLEGFGLPVLEAMGCGTPVACSDRASLPEVGGEAVLYFNPAEPEAIQAELERLADSPELCRDLAARGPVRAAQFTWERSARAVCAAIQQAGL